MKYISIAPLEICKKLKSFPCSITPPQIATTQEESVTLLLDFLPQDFSEAKIFLISSEVFEQIITSVQREEEI